MMLNMASEMLERDKEEKREEREAALSERLPPLQLSGLSMQDLQVCAGRHTPINTHGSDISVRAIPLNYAEAKQLTWMYSNCFRVQGLISYLGPYAVVVM